MKATNEPDLNGHLEATDAVCCGTSRFFAGAWGPHWHHCRHRCDDGCGAPDDAWPIDEHCDAAWLNAGRQLVGRDGHALDQPSGDLPVEQYLPSVQDAAGAPVVKRGGLGLHALATGSGRLHAGKGAEFFGDGAMSTISLLMEHLDYGALRGSIGGTHSHVVCSAVRALDA